MMSCNPGIVQILAGQCGLSIGAEFWRQIAAEHGIDLKGYQVGSDEQLGKCDALFHHSAFDKRFVARSVLVDLEPGVIEGVRSSDCGSMFYPNNLLSGQNGAGNNWAKGHYTEGPELVPQIMDIVRRDAERCDALQGFQLVHSLGGGTGSGLGTLLLSKVKEEFPDRVVNTFSVAPSMFVSDTVVEPYNTIFSLSNLVENSEGTFMLDNDALYSICQRTLEKPTPTYRDINILVAQTMAGVTASLRYPGQLNSDLRKLAMNLIPFPRLHFYASGLAPLGSPQSLKQQRLTVSDLIHKIIVGRNFMVNCDLSQGRYITMAAMMRGSFSQNEVEMEFSNMQKKNSAAFVPWVPNNVTISCCSNPPLGKERSATIIGNNSAIADVFRRFATQFETMFSKKAYLHWYTGEGMDLQEFTEALCNVRDLVGEYQMRGDSDYDEIHLDEDDNCQEELPGNGHLE